MNFPTRFHEKSKLFHKVVITYELICFDLYENTSKKVHM